MSTLREDSLYELGACPGATLFKPKAIRVELGTAFFTKRAPCGRATDSNPAPGQKPLRDETGSVAFSGSYTLHDQDVARRPALGRSLLLEGLPAQMKTGIASARVARRRHNTGAQFARARRRLPCPRRNDPREPPNGDARDRSSPRRKGHRDGPISPGDGRTHPLQQGPAIDKSGEAAVIMGERHISPAVRDDQPNLVGLGLPKEFVLPDGGCMQLLAEQISDGRPVQPPPVFNHWRRRHAPYRDERLPGRGLIRRGRRALDEAP